MGSVALLTGSGPKRDEEYGPGRKMVLVRQPDVASSTCFPSGPFYITPDMDTIELTAWGGGGEYRVVHVECSFYHPCG